MIAAIFGTPEVPPAALARLREVGLAQDPPVEYGMRLVPSAAGQYWAITKVWGASDSRREAIRLGQMAEKDANDIVATLPGDCSPEDAGAFVMRFFKRSVDPKKDAIRAVQESVAAEERAQEANLQRFVLEQTDKAIRTTDHERRLIAGEATAHPMVPGVGDGEKKKGSGKQGRSSDQPE